MAEANSLKGKKLTVTKIEDTRFEGQHPNGINVDFVRTGECIVTPEIGNRFTLYDRSLSSAFSTSSVTAFDPNTNRITTLNSVYEITNIE